MHFYDEKESLTDKQTTKLHAISINASAIRFKQSNAKGRLVGCMDGIACDQLVGLLVRFYSKII